MAHILTDSLFIPHSTRLHGISVTHSMDHILAKIAPLYIFAVFLKGVNIRIFCEITKHILGNPEAVSLIVCYCNVKQRKLSR